MEEANSTNGWSTWPCGVGFTVGDLVKIVHSAPSLISRVTRRIWTASAYLSHSQTQCELHSYSCTPIWFPGKFASSGNRRWGSVMFMHFSCWWNLFWSLSLQRCSKSCKQYWHSRGTRSILINPSFLGVFTSPPRRKRFPRGRGVHQTASPGLC